MVNDWYRICKPGEVGQILRAMKCPDCGETHYCWDWPTVAEFKKEQEKTITNCDDATCTICNRESDENWINYVDDERPLTNHDWKNEV